MALKAYKCPCCGGALSFDPSLQKVKCPYCDTEFEVEAVTGREDLDETAVEETAWTRDGDEKWDGSEDGACVFVCRSCGGEIVGDGNTAATACPYCGNPVVMTGRLSGALKPDLVIPFKLGREDAKAAYMKHVTGKRLLPKVFRDENHIDEIKGIYVPFWLFDADANADLLFRATRVRTWSDRKYDYVETSYYDVERAGSLSFGRVPVDGSSKMEDALMESLEPFDQSEAVDFKTAYLAGFFADKYDVDDKESIARAEQRIRTSTEQVFASTVTGFHSVIPRGGTIRLKNGTTRYALYPVWLLNTTWNGTRYTFAMNGQTGKFIGDLPVDKAAAVRWFIGIALATAAAVFALLSWLF